MFLGLISISKEVTHINFKIANFIVQLSAIEEFYVKGINFNQI